MKLQNAVALRIAGVVLACAMLAGCGGQTVTVPGAASMSQAQSGASASSSSSEASSASSASSAGAGASDPASTGAASSGKAAGSASKPAAAPVVGGSLQLTEKETKLGDYELFTMFKNGYAWVWANGEAGYLSDEGQYTPLYSIPREAIFDIDVEQMTTDGSTLQRNVVTLSDFYSYPESGIVPFFEDGLWGYCDLSGNVLVQPAYIHISPMGQLGWGAREGDPGSEHIYYYDVFKPDGSVVVTSKTCWCDPRNGYYFVGVSGSGVGAVLYNADGSVVLEDAPYSFGNCPMPNFTTWEEGVVVDGVPYDRTGEKLGTDGLQITGISTGSRPTYKGDGGLGILNTDGSVVIPDSLSYISGVMTDGSIYVQQKADKKLLHYDMDLNVYEGEALARAYTWERYVDEERLVPITPVEILDQNGRQIALLESEIEMGSAYSLTCGVLKAGDWFYFYPDNTTVQAYQLTPAE